MVPTFLSITSVLILRIVYARKSSNFSIKRADHQLLMIGLFCFCLLSLMLQFNLWQIIEPAAILCQLSNQESG